MLVMQAAFGITGPDRRADLLRVFQGRAARERAGLATDRPDVVRDLGEVVAELMPPAVEFARSRARQFGAEQGTDARTEPSHRHGCGTGKPARQPASPRTTLAAPSPESCHPSVGAHERRSDEEQPDQIRRKPGLHEELHQHEGAQRVSGQRERAGKSPPDSLRSPVSRRRIADRPRWACADTSRDIQGPAFSAMNRRAGGPLRRLPCFRPE